VKRIATLTLLSAALAAPAHADYVTIQGTYLPGQYDLPVAMVFNDANNDRQLEIGERVSLNLTDNFGSNFDTVLRIATGVTLPLFNGQTYTLVPNPFTDSTCPSPDTSWCFTGTQRNGLPTELISSAAAYKFYEITRVAPTPPTPSIVNPDLTAQVSGQAYAPAAVAEGPAGTFSFTSTFCNKPTSSATLLELSSETRTLTNGNSLINRSLNGTGTPPGGVGSELFFPLRDDFSDYRLAPGECVDVDYKIGLTARSRFLFHVDALGVETPSTVTVPTTTGAPVTVCGGSGTILAGTVAPPPFDGVFINAINVRVTAISPPPTQGYASNGVPFGCGESDSDALPYYDAAQSSLEVTYDCSCP